MARKRWSVSFGPETCRDLPIASSREWIETNGLGGYAMGTVSGLPTRRYHGLLVASLRPPVGRTLLLSSLQESVETPEGSFPLGCLRYPGAVRVAYKAFPLDMHPHALLAAMAARSAQTQGKFWSFHDRLFSQEGLDFDTLLRHAESAGLELPALRRDLESLAYGPEVSRDLRLGRRLGVSSTPTFFINGRMLTGAQPLDEFEALVEEELVLAERWLAQRRFEMA